MGKETYIQVKRLNYVGGCERTQSLQTAVWHVLVLVYHCLRLCVGGAAYTYAVSALYT